VTLSWQATGDDGRTGTAQRYDLRYRTDHPITSQSAFAAATQVQKVPQPKSAGTQQSTTIGVGTDTTYYFAMVAIDDAANASPLTALGRDVTPVPSLQISPPAPQPARSQATLLVAADEEQTVRAELYDAMGRRVSVLFDDRVPAFQRRRIQVDVSQLASGMYFLRVRGATSARTEQLVVVK
jgi:lysyl endopeptidase